MELWHIKCNEGFKNKGDYEEYSDAVVLAETEEEAKDFGVATYGWEKSENVDAEYIGK